MIYVLDTNIVLQDPTLSNYKGKTVYLPIEVLKELDNQKTREGEVGFKSRVFHRKLKEIENLKEEFYYINETKIINPTKELEQLDGNMNFEPTIADHWFIQAFILNRNDEFVAHTSDFSCYNLMRVHGKNCEYVNDTRAITNLSLLYKGHQTLYVNSEVINKVYKEGYCSVQDLQQDCSFNENECVTLKDYSSKQSVMTKFTDGRLVKLKFNEKQSWWGLQALSEEQKYALSLLSDDDIRIVTLTGEAGTSKTILSFAVGLETKVNNFGKGKLYIAKPPVPLSNRMKLGYKKGDLLAKAIGTLGSYATNLERLSNLKGENRKLDGSKMLIDLMEQCDITYLNLEDILGISFSDDDYIIIDEAELLTKDEMKTILTRGGKMIIIGDIDQQCSDSRIDADKSGLLRLIEIGKKSKLIAHLTLEKVYRSKIVEEINKIW